MTWLAPGYLLAGLAAALVVGALHLLAWRRPPAVVLPTARFVPDAPARARARATRPVDRLLLALRVLALLLAGAALARPVRTPERASLSRIVVADLSASAGDAAAVRTAAREAWRPGDVLVIVGARTRAVATPDSLVAGAGDAPGRLSTALVVADDAARALAERADSVELVLVSPLAREEVDAATAPLARAWSGRVRHARVAPAASVAATRAVTVQATGDDAIAAGVLAAATRSAADVRVVRRAPTAADSVWTGEVPGRVLVTWADTGAGAAARSAALAWKDDALVAPLAPAGEPAPGRVVVRWADGTPAATERALGDGCVRDVRIALPRAGDVVLAPAFGRLLTWLAAPCGGPRDPMPLAPDSLGLALSGPARALARPAPRDPWAIARWLLGGAIVLLLLEPLARRGPASDAERDAGDAARQARAEAA